METPETPVPPRKNFFTRPKQLVSGADLRPAAIIPEGTNMNELTDSVVASAVIHQAESKKNLARFAEENREYEAGVVRREMAEAEENARKEKERTEKARLRAEETAQLAIGRQLRLKRRLAELSAECASAKSLLDAIDDKDALEITIFKATVAALNKSLSV